jgi:hypothetical protein
MVIFGNSRTRAALFPFLLPLPLGFLPFFPFGGVRLSIGFLHWSGAGASLGSALCAKLAELERLGIASHD